MYNVASVLYAKKIINVLCNNYIPMIMIHPGTGSRLFFKQFSKWSSPSPPLEIIKTFTKSRGMLQIKNIRTIPINIKNDLSRFALKESVEFCFWYGKEDDNLFRIYFVLVSTDDLYGLMHFSSIPLNFRQRCSWLINGFNIFFSFMLFKKFVSLIFSKRLFGISFCFLIFVTHIISFISMHSVFSVSFLFAFSFINSLSRVCVPRDL